MAYTPLPNQSELPLIMTVYSDGTYTYICESYPGNALSTANWRVTRITNADNTIRMAGTGIFDQLATNSTVVGALTYS